MKSAITLILFVMLSGVIMPIVAAFGCIFADNFLEYLSISRLSRVEQETDAAIISAAFVLALKGKKDIFDCLKSVKSRVFTRLSDKSIRYIKNEYQSIDEFIFCRIQKIFL